MGDSDMVIARQMKNRGSFDSAIILFTKAEALSLKSGKYDDWTKAVSGVIDCYRAKGDLEEALRLTDNALVKARNLIDTTGPLYCILIHKKAALYSDQRQFVNATELFTKNINIYLSKLVLSDTGLALSYNGLGTVYYLQNKNADALREYNSAVETYEKAGHTRSADYASSIQNLGIVYSTTGNFEKAEQFFLKSLKVNQDILQPTDPKLATFYINMGRFYQIIRNDSKAIEYMNKAENIYSSQNLSNSIPAASLFLNMGVSYIYTADYEKAQSYFNKSLEIISVKTPGNLDGLINIYLNMGFIAEKKGDYTTARELYLKGIINWG